jgi:hypothetical protein
MVLDSGMAEGRKGSLKGYKRRQAFKGLYISRRRNQISREKEKEEKPILTVSSQAGEHAKILCNQKIMAFSTYTVFLLTDEELLHNPKAQQD